MVVVFVVSSITLLAIDQLRIRKLKRILLICEPHYSRIFQANSYSELSSWIDAMPTRLLPTKAHIRSVLRFLRSPAVPVEGDLKAMPLLKASDAGSIKTLTEKVMLTNARGANHERGRWQ